MHQVIGVREKNSATRMKNLKEKVGLKLQQKQQQPWGGEGNQFERDALLFFFCIYLSLEDLPKKKKKLIKSERKIRTYSIS